MRERIKNSASVGPATGFEEKLKVEKTEKNVHELWTTWTSGFGEFFRFCNTREFMIFIRFIINLL